MVQKNDESGVIGTSEYQEIRLQKTSRSGHQEKSMLLYGGYPMYLHTEVHYLIT